MRGIVRQGWTHRVVRAASTGISADADLRERRVRDAAGSHAEAEWQEILERCGRKCARCEISGENERLTKDHIVPLALGGTDYASNLQPLCRSCNSWKGNRELDFRKSAILREHRKPDAVVVAGSDAPVEVEVAATA